MKRAWVRGVAENFTAATVRQAFDRAPDLVRARQQHAAYVAALATCGVQVAWLPASTSADGCFVEDQAVLAGGAALLTRAGHAPRRVELASVAAGLAESHRTTAMASPGTLDGGDVLRVGARLYVGRSARTSEAGVRQLADWARPLGLEVIEVTVADALHLKCFATTPGRGHLVIAPDRVDPGAFEGLRLIEVASHEAYAANVVGVGGSVLVAAGFPKLAAALRALGWQVVTLPMDEFERADGSLTCLSLRWDPADPDFV